ncbi:MAG: cytochrome c oxidase subunit [Actinomycetota bacterium]|nr:cytochrome c oxidase subunit [Actinomycetota bacterium]
MATIAQRLTSIWEEGPGLSSALTTVDHKRIGKRYIYTALFFFMLAGLEAMVMRAQLARPEQSLVSPNEYNQLFTMHGVTMIFFFATPMLSGFGNYFLPLMLGARDMAFPRLNAFGYWVFLLSGLFMSSSLLIGRAPTDGWFNYTPFALNQYSPGLNIDFYTLGIIFLGISSTAGAINFIVTIFKLRAPGMTVARMPLFSWAILATSFSIVFALPSLTVANLLLELQRRFGFHFFDVAKGGDDLLWQHLFWIFGHPDVYIIVLPALGIVSTIIPVFSRRPIVAYPYVALATIITAIIGFGVWVHHMFATGLPNLSMTFFSAASLLITIPAGVQIFAWLTTMVKGKVQLKTPMLFMIGFIVVFVLGGLTGVMFAAIPFDQQITDSYFVVAHFHYVLFGGAVFPIFGAMYFWLPKMTGKMLSERLGKWSFWLIFVGFNVTFFPMHIMGLLGMPRRIYTYQPNLGWDIPNLISSIGAYVLAAGVIVFLIDFYLSVKRGAPAGPDPWGAESLEWAIESPPPAYNFASIPVVSSRQPLWDNPNLPTEIAAGRAGPLLADGHQTVGTSMLDADEEDVLAMPGESPWPLATAVGMLVLFFGMLVSHYSIAIAGGVMTAGGIAAWLWPTADTETEAH